MTNGHSFGHTSCLAFLTSVPQNIQKFYVLREVYITQDMKNIC